MKKITILFLLVLSMTLISLSGKQPSSASLTCDIEPEFYSIGTNVLNISDGDPFILTMTFYNDCGHIISGALINGTLFTVEDGTIALQGFSSIYLPGAILGYMVGIPMIYDVSMGTSFEITHFSYVVFPNLNHTVVTIENSYDIPGVMDPVDPDPPDPSTTINYVITVTDDAIIITDSTGATKSILFDSLFFAGLYVNYVGDVADFIMNPGGTTMTFVSAAMDTYDNSDGFTDFTSDLIYDMIMVDDGLSDLVLNKALDYMIVQMQEAEPEYLFPGEYMMINNEFVEVLVDDEGNIILDSSGNPIVDPNGNTAGEINPLWTLDPDGWMAEALKDFAAVILEMVGIDVDLIPILEWMVNHWGFVLVSIVLSVFGLLTISFWWPLIPWVFSTIFVITKSVFFSLRDVLRFLSENAGKAINKRKRA